MGALAPICMSSVCMYLCMYVCISIYMYERMYVCMYVCMHSCMYVCMSECMCAVFKSFKCFRRSSRKPNVEIMFQSGESL